VPSKSEVSRPTLELVAAVAGVSRGTASRALNGSPNVSAKALTAVKQAAATLGYHPNLAARSLALGRSETIGLVISETDERLFDDPFFAAIVRGAHAEMRDSGTQLVLSLAQTDEEREQLVRFASGHHLDGVLLVSVHADDPLPRALAEAGVPVVNAGRPPEVRTPSVPGSDALRTTDRLHEDLWWVDADNRGGARAATEHLLDRGCRRVAAIAGPSDMGAGRDRLAGWRDALSTATDEEIRGLATDDRRVVEADFTEGSGFDAMQSLLRQVPDLDGVFVASDLMAFGALAALRQAGRRVPDDVAVVGFDDVATAAVSDPPLTTVAQPVEQMGRIMAGLLLARTRGEVPEQCCVVLPTTLVVRASA
jgi:DNA-binding LacI/PurR family transcriptional regulator